METVFTVLLVSCTHPTAKGTTPTDEQRGARFAVVVGIVGFIDVPIVALAITLWRTQHPDPVIFQGGLNPPMLLMLLVCLAAFTTLYSLLLMQRVSMKNAEIEIKRLKELCS